MIIIEIRDIGSHLFQDLEKNFTRLHYIKITKSCIELGTHPGELAVTAPLHFVYVN